MDGLSDEALLAGLGSGNPDAAAAFVRRFQGRVYGLAVTMLHDRDLADEVAQETFVRAWRHAATYDPRRGRVPTWLLTIARNLAIDRASLRPVIPVDPELIAAELDSPSTTPCPTSPSASACARPSPDYPTTSGGRSCSRRMRARRRARSRSSIACLWGR